MTYREPVAWGYKNRTLPDVVTHVAPSFFSQDTTQPRLRPCDSKRHHKGKKHYTNFTNHILNRFINHCVLLLLICYVFQPLLKLCRPQRLVLKAVLESPAVSSRRIDMQSHRDIETAQGPEIAYAVLGRYTVVG